MQRFRLLQRLRACGSRKYENNGQKPFEILH
jgi:hypothetical protein